MTKQELSKYAGSRIYAQVKRMGGKGCDIDCITIYEITDNGTLAYITEVMNCVANKKQIAIANKDYPYRVFGRPTAAKIDIKDIDNLIK